MNIAVISRLVSDLTDLLYENDYFIQSYSVPKTKTIKKLKNEEWNCVRFFENIIQFIFAKQIITLKINKGTLIVRKRISKLSPCLVLNFKYKNKETRERESMRLHIVNASIISTKLNYSVPENLRNPSWLDDRGKIIYSLEEFKKDTKGKEERLLYQFLLNDSRWGLTGDVVSELYYDMGYYSDQKISDSDLDDVHSNIRRHLISIYLLGGKGPELDGEMGESHRNWKIFGKKSDRIERKSYKGHSLFFMKKNNTSD